MNIYATLLLWLLLPWPDDPARQNFYSSLQQAYKFGGKYIQFKFLLQNEVLNHSLIHVVKEVQQQQKWWENWKYTYLPWYHKTNMMLWKKKLMNFTLITKCQKFNQTMVIQNNLTNDKHKYFKWIGFHGYQNKQKHVCISLVVQWWSNHSGKMHLSKINLGNHPCF